LTVSVRDLIHRNRGLLLLVLLAVLLAGVGASVFSSAYVRVLHRGFEDRSLAYAQAFAASAIPWVDRGETELLRSAALLFLAGSARYVQVWDGSDLLIDERVNGYRDLTLEPLETPLASSAGQSADATSLLDVRVPIEIQGSAGYIRVGVGRTSVAAQARSAMAAAAGSALGFVALFAGGLVFARSRGARGHRDSEPMAADTILQAGGLAVDPVRKTVELDGRPVSVTPKQYKLLELLAGEPGRVFSEEDILAAAWPDSPYADAKDIKQYVYLVRRRLAEVDPEAKRLIETVPGFGYRMVAPAVDQDLTP